MTIASPARALLVLAALGLAGCSVPGEAPVRYLIGVSQANLSEPWRVSMTDEIQRQAAVHPELRVIVADASDSLGKQIGDVEKFEGLGVDLLIISPLESEALTPTVTRVFQKVPVIVLNRSVANYDYSLFIGPDNARIGQEAGRFVAGLLHDRGGEVLEVLGRSGSPPTLERAEGFRTEIARNPLVHLQSPVLANWLRDGAEDLVADRLKADGPPRVVFAHNDAMAYGAWLAAERLHLAKQITFLGVDGLPGARGGLEMLRNGILDGTFVSPTGGKEAVEYALALLRHQGEQPKKVILGTRFLTRNDLAVPPAENHPRGRPRTVFFVPSDGRDGWHRSLRTSVEEALRAGGWTLLEAEAGSEVLPKAAEALVIDTGFGGDRARSRAEAFAAQARAAGIPLALVGPQPASGDDGGWLLALGPDTFEEGLRAGRWLGGAGVHRVLELTGPSSASGTAERSRGLLQGLAERTTARAAGLRETDGTRTAAREAVAQALASPEAFDAVFAHSDELALGASDALHAAVLPADRRILVAAVGGAEAATAALSDGNLACLVRSPSALGPLLRGDLDRALTEPGVSRRLVTSHDVVVR